MRSQPTIQLPDPGPPNPEFEQPADGERLLRVAGALRARGIQALIAESAQDAKRRVLDLVPDGAEVHVALSETMAQLGVTTVIETSQSYDAVRPKLLGLDRETQRREMRKLATAPDYMLGSAQAITDDGEILVASGSGSQLGPYAQAAERVVLAVGHQKIVKDLYEGLRRIREYALPREDARMKSLGMPGSVISKILIIEREFGERITVILVPATLGF